MKVTIAGDDGTRRQVYRVRCRWLPWEPGTPRVAELLLGFFGKSDTGVSVGSPVMQGRSPWLFSSCL